MGEKGCALMSRHMQCSVLNGRLTSHSPSTLDKIASTQKPRYKGSLTLFLWERMDLLNEKLKMEKENGNKIRVNLTVMIEKK